ncbi:PR domain zinc finger protein 5-like [Culicoides brevitarsis]|uniref:PR domain zinc finger protein 5-like n=1 Tax=Culicoides brevitarsis TaxID=469753 RepID=UPI00307BC913
MDMAILNQKSSETKSSGKRNPSTDDCRICWNRIIGQGFLLDSKSSSHSSETFSEMYYYVSGIVPKAEPKSLCWGCAKELTFAHKIMKKVTEKENLQEDHTEILEEKTDKIIVEREDVKPTSMEMVVIKIEPDDFYEMDTENVDSVEDEERSSSSDAESSSSTEVSSDEEDPKPRKSTVKRTPNKKTSQSNKPNLIQCALCIYNTRNKENYKKHVFGHHPEQKLKCDGCEKEFLFIYELEAHRKEIHGFVEKYVAQLKPDWVLPPVSKYEGEKIAVKQESTVESNAEEKQYKLDILGRRIPINRVYKKREVKYPKKERKLPIQCPLCPYTGIGKANFRNHYRVKHNKQELQCDGCEAKFHLFYRLYRHREEEHNFSHEYVVDESLKVTYEQIKDRPRKPYVRKPKHGQYFPCPKCDQMLRGPRMLNDHLKEAHNYVKDRSSEKVICNFCGKFVANQNLEYHIRHLHPEQRDPFVCDYCGEKLKSKTILLRHMQAVHKLALKVNGSACALMCRFCTEIFKTKHRRISHEVRIHTFDYRFNCTLCGKKFFMKRHLDAHMKAHAKGNLKKSKLKCHICGENFSRKQILADHISTHCTQEVSSFSDNLAKNLVHLVALKYEQNDD